MLLPPNVEKIYRELNNKDELTEIRLRTGKNIIFCFGCREKICKETFSEEDAKKYFSAICGGAPYSKIKEQREGYVTVDGCRIGFCGNYSFSEEEMRHIENISSFCIRIPRQVKGCAKVVYRKLFEGSFMLDTLVISPPGCGKTTILRDIIRMLSSDGFNVCVADERSEIAPLQIGEELEIGQRTDVISGVKKSVAMKNMIRSMKPDIIAADELSGKDDIEAIEEARASGVTVLATIHGKSISDAVTKIKTGFDRYIILEGRGIVKGVYGKDGEKCS